MLNIYLVIVHSVLYINRLFIHWIVFIAKYNFRDERGIGSQPLSDKLGKR